MVSSSKMFAWGANTHGQLGTRDTTDRFEPEYIQDANVSVITGGGSHSVYTDGIDVYTCGSNYAGQIGREGVPLHFQKIGKESKYSVSSVVCGWDFTFVLQNDGCLTAFGSNVHNQLLNSEIRQMSKPIRASLPTVRCVAAGLRHVIALSDTSNEVLLWGSNRRGQLDTTTSKTTENGLPVYLKLGSSSWLSGYLFGRCLSFCYFDSDIIMYQFVTYVTDAGFVYIIGELKYFGEDGNIIIPTSLGDLPARVFTPDSFGGRPAVQTASGWSNALALTDTGVVFTWGRSDLGQLGRPHLLDCHSGSSPTPEFDPLPGRVSFGDDDGSVTRIVDIRAGSEHSLAIDSEGNLWTWGWNEHGMCGVPNNTISENDSLNYAGDNKHCPCVVQPTRVNLLPVSSCQGLRLPTARLTGAGYGHSFACVV
ncbi:hypothetical protein AHF37_06759 [Paragonimus kellicotti]|nr:hypothetical protein AHF37_06759 [Paragonimus kellicotti]